MTKLSVSILFALALCTMVYCKQCKEAQPTCPDIHGTEDVLTILPVITDCSKYIMCDQGVAVVRPCPGDLVFNRAEKVCDFPYHANCIQCEL